MEQIKETKRFLVEKGITNATIGIVLGTGLHKILEHVDILQTLPYNEIPNFPVSTVEFHKGNLVYGKLGDKYVLVMQGRFHQYEGYTMEQIVFPIRVMKLLGVKALFLSNAAGGINLHYKKGNLVLLDDHINLQSGNPLTGKNYDELGGRFPDMSEPYSSILNQLMQNTATGLEIDLKKGVYAAVNGPNLETRAEYRYLKVIGADMVGMSTVPEVIAANHCQLPCAAISVITDECDPDNLKPINIAEIIGIASKADENVARLLRETIAKLDFDTIIG